jgi:hypothetical protein
MYLSFNISNICILLWTGDIFQTSRLKAIRSLSYIDMVAAVVIQPLHPFMTLLKTDIIFNKRLETRYDRCGTLQRDVMTRCVA